MKPPSYLQPSNGRELDQSLLVGRSEPRLTWRPRLLRATIGAFLVPFLWSCAQTQSTNELPPHRELPPSATQPFSAPEPTMYRVQVGDELDIQVLQRSDLSPVLALSGVAVNEVGDIYMPLAGVVRVVGLTEEELREKVAQALSKELRQPIIDVRVSNALGERVFLLGEVKNPGVYTAGTNMSLLELIAVAGGPTLDADMSKIDPYSNSKACAELVTSAFRQAFFSAGDSEHPRVAVATVRAGNVIGGGDWAEDRLVPDII